MGEWIWPTASPYNLWTRWNLCDLLQKMLRLRVSLLALSHAALILFSPWRQSRFRFWSRGHLTKPRIWALCPLGHRVQIRSNRALAQSTAVCLKDRYWDLKNSTPTPKIWQTSSTTISWTTTCMRTTLNLSSIQRLLTFRMPSWNSRIVLNQYMSGADPGDCNWIRRKQNWFGLDRKPVWRRLFILIWTCTSELTS